MLLEPFFSPVVLLRLLRLSCLGSLYPGTLEVESAEEVDHWSNLLCGNSTDDIYRSGSMNSEDVIVYFTALVAIGIIVVGLLTTALHSYLIAPIVIIGIVLAAFVLLSKGNFAHKIESIEKICFVITFLAIICSFILLYKPM